ncbi:MAG: exo-alpha-sialidase, partial [bacterium]|nr:exo-alpha-sialidase [bacterium]
PILHVNNIPMKQLSVITAMLLFMGAGCSASTPLTNDFTPATVAATPPAGADGGAFERQVKTAISYDGINFVQNDRWVGGQFNVPDAIVRENGDIYLYMTGQTVGERFNETALAISSDGGENWTYKYLEFGNDYPLERSPVDPDVIQLEDGTIRMFFTAPAGKSTIGIYYADSSDGINFTYMGSIWIPNEGSALDSTTFKIGDTWHMYIMKDMDASQQFHLESTDAAEFEFDSITTIVYEGETHMPSNGIVIDDKYHLFMFHPGDGMIRSMWTKDGIYFYPNEGTSLEPVDKEEYVKDPTVIDMGDHYLMFYVTNL